MRKYKIIHVGSMPPPLGGISVYLYRLSKSNNSISVLDTKTIFFSKSKKIIWFLKQIFSLSPKHFIYHNPILHLRVSFYILSCISIHRYSLVLHGNLLHDQYSKGNIIIKFIIKRTLRKSQWVQIVGEHLKELLLDLGISDNKIVVKNAFLPPPIEEEKIIYQSYDAEMLSFIAKHSPLLIANASSLVIKDEIDLYGFDLCISLIEMLKIKFPTIGFIFALANSKDNQQYLDRQLEVIARQGLVNNFYLVDGQKEIWPLFKTCDLFIRPTNEDGYGISIDEAIYFNCPVIASDVCRRNHLAVLFENRNINDLYQKSLQILNKKTNNHK